MRLVSRFALGAALVLSAAASVSTEAAAENMTRRFCDQRVTYDIVPPVDVPADLARLSGVWRGTVILAGGSEMCVAMIVKEVSADGQVVLAIAWTGAEWLRGHVFTGYPWNPLGHVWRLPRPCYRARRCSASMGWAW